MADKPIVCVGNSTSRVGKVLSGSSSSAIKGKAVARQRPISLYENSSTRMTETTA
ncbi:PAAR domain-containing protein [Roseateles koreensis]|uniref:Uncharacterized protein n=1 Tax=Roseateles koreensis TaxID=2987526 RepID=A0ABT5KWD9_9BURK|nr:hypothetical protein [Roseateles koreensis]MDC8786097.1 hypothetical protein [Roseateles koreensis]